MLLRWVLDGAQAGCRRTDGVRRASLLRTLLALAPETAGIHLILEAIERSLQRKGCSRVDCLYCGGGCWAGVVLLQGLISPRALRPADYALDHHA